MVTDWEFPRDMSRAVLEQRLDVAQSELTGRGILKVEVTTWNPAVGELIVIVHTASPDGPQRWRMDLSAEEADMRLLDARSFVITMRANIEEWWAVKDREPWVADWATLLNP